MLGIAYRSLGDFSKAIKNHTQNLANAKEVGDRAGQGRAYGGLGNAYKSLTGGTFPRGSRTTRRTWRFSFSKAGSRWQTTWTPMRCGVEHDVQRWRLREKNLSTWLVNKNKDMALHFWPDIRSYSLTHRELIADAISTPLAVEAALYFKYM